MLCSHLVHAVRSIVETCPNLIPRAIHLAGYWLVPHLIFVALAQQVTLETIAIISRFHELDVILELGRHRQSLPVFLLLIETGAEEV